LALPFGAPGTAYRLPAAVADVALSSGAQSRAKAPVAAWGVLAVGFVWLGTVSSQAVLSQALRLLANKPCAADPANAGLAMVTTPDVLAESASRVLGRCLPRWRHTTANTTRMTRAQAAAMPATNSTGMRAWLGGFVVADAPVIRGSEHVDKDRVATRRCAYMGIK